MSWNNKNDYIFFESLWYFINSFNYTVNMWGFQTGNDKKIKRILPWKFFEYFIVYYLYQLWYEKDFSFKENPFIADNWVDITLKWVPLHLKSTTMKNMVCQVRNWPWVVDKLQEKWGYLLMWYINPQIIDAITPGILHVIDHFWYWSPQNEIKYEDIKNFWIHKWYYNHYNTYLDEFIEFIGCISVADYFDNTLFVKYWELFPYTNISQNFTEWSFILDNIEKLKESGKIITFRELLKQIENKNV